MKFCNQLEHVYQPEIDISSFDLIREEIENRVDIFFKCRDIYKYKIVSEKLTIFDILFHKIDFSDFFYEGIFRDLESSDHIIGYSITANTKVADELCTKSGLRYSTIKLCNEPVFYYIYFSLETISQLLQDKIKKYK